jgi:hypothetical protein
MHSKTVIRGCDVNRTCSARLSAKDFWLPQQQQRWRQRRQQQQLNCIHHRCSDCDPLILCLAPCQRQQQHQQQHPPRGLRHHQLLAESCPRWLSVRKLDSARARSLGMENKKKDPATPFIPGPRSPLPPSLPPSRKHPSTLFPMPAPPSAKLPFARLLLPQVPSSHLPVNVLGPLQHLN